MLNEQQELSNALFDIAYTQRGLTIYKDEENAVQYNIYVYLRICMCVLYKEEYICMWI